jgi:hypothetical protein
MLTPTRMPPMRASVIVRRGFVGDISTPW